MLSTSACHRLKEKKGDLNILYFTCTQSILLWWFFLFYVLVYKNFFLCCWRLMYVFIFLVKLTEWPPIGKIAAHSAYDMFHGIST